MSASGKLTAYLEGLAQRMSGSVEVGFMEGSTYPDGTPVAAVANWNEFGTSTAPPRPFFRTMIAKESPTWGPKMAKLAQATHNDGAKVLAIMGADIEGALKQSINDFSDPPNAQSTIDQKGFDKPLIDKGIMVNSTGYRVTGTKGRSSSEESDTSEESFGEIVEEIAEAPEALL